MAQLVERADALFEAKKYSEALPLYSQLVSLDPSDRVLNYKFGTCILFGGGDKEKAIGYLKFATEYPAIPTLAWYWLGRAYHLNYRFKDAQNAYQRFVGTGDKKALSDWPVEALQQQCRNGEKLLSSLKEITVRNKVEVQSDDFFRYYDLRDIGGKIVVVPEELRTSLDKKKEYRGLVYLSKDGGPIYFSSYGKDGKTGLDIYRTELVNGSYATPVKLAGYVNTVEDEDFAFLHPDGKGFYFSSKGHSSMGGFDIFRAAYDKVSETFGVPENLDFAVNTPDDDLFYIVDPEQNEACFASARSSGQGNLTVYRVATKQVQLNLTIFKGTFANAYNSNDRKAHITVVDDLTREKLVDVLTDINGAYVLSVPRSGKFRFRVECGPTGKTHVALVEVPPADAAVAYQQEIELINKNGSEELVIRTNFDTPLKGDIISLALDEIRRRARLDITEQPNVAETPEPVAVEDVMTAAGFTGDIDKATAVRLAQKDAAGQESRIDDLRKASDEAFNIAISSIEASEKHVALAEELVAKAEATDDESIRAKLMIQAAQERQKGTDAYMRARSAKRVGEDLAMESDKATQNSATAAKLARDLSDAVSTGNDKAALPLLKALKVRTDEVSRPDPDNDLTERARRAVTEKSQEGARVLNHANRKRIDENDLKDRIARIESELSSARGAKKEGMQQEVAEYRTQLGYLKAETDAEFAKAEVLVRETKVLKGQAGLTRKLLTDNSTQVNKPDKTKLDALGQRIGGTGLRIDRIGIDERYALDQVSPEEEEARMFAWDLPGVGLPVAATDVVQNDVTNTSGSVSNLPRNTEVAQVVPLEDRTSDNVANPDGSSNSDTNGELAEELTEGSNNSPFVDPALTTTTGNPSVNTPSTTSNGMDENASNSVSNTNGTNATDSSKNNSSNTANVNTTPHQVELENSTTGLTPEQIRDQGSELPGWNLPPTAPAVDPETKRFMLENELAELEQLVNAEKNKTKKDSILMRMEELDILLNAPVPENEIVEQKPEYSDEVLKPTIADMKRVPITFDPELKEEKLIEMIYAKYEANKVRLQNISDPVDRADALNGLEITLGDSIRGEMVRQLAVLQLEPKLAEIILKRLDRLGTLREEHLAQGLSYVKEVDPSYGATAIVTPPSTTVERSNGISIEEALPEAREIIPRQRDPLLDRFIMIDEDPMNIYESDLDHRAIGVKDAIAFKNESLARMASLQNGIDSITDLMMGHARDREYDKLIKNRALLEDEQYIIRTDLGQRTVFLTSKEWANAQDSTKALEKSVEREGFSEDEPLLEMARALRAEANYEYRQAGEMRKRADNIQNIIERDSLYRTAYATELAALKDVDQAITIQNYLISDEHVNGEKLPYSTVASRVFGIPETPDPIGTDLAEQGVNISPEAEQFADATSNPHNTEPLSPIEEELEAAEAIEQTVVTTPAIPEIITPTNATAQVEGVEQPAENVNDQITGTPSTEITTQQQEIKQVDPSNNATNANGANTANSAETNLEKEIVSVIPEEVTETIPPAIVGSDPNTTTAPIGSEQNNVDANEPEVPRASEANTTEQNTAVTNTAPVSVPLEVAENTASIPDVSTNTSTPSEIENEVAAIIKRQETPLTPEQKVSVETFVAYLNPAQGFSGTLVSDEPAEDLGRLLIMRERLEDEANELDRSAMEKSSLADENRAAATTAKRRKKGELEKIAAINSALADSLNKVALQRRQEAVELEDRIANAQKAAEDKQRMLKYYYLTPEEMLMVEQHRDQSSYFSSMVISQEQSEASRMAANSAAANRSVGESIRNEAIKLGKDHTDPKNELRAQLLHVRAGALLARADSLTEVSVRLKNAAKANNDIAEVTLNDMEPVRALETQKLEERTTRDPELLATIVQNNKNTSPTPVSEQVPSTVPTVSPNEPTPTPETSTSEVVTPDPTGTTPEVITPTPVVPTVVEEQPIGRTVENATTTSEEPMVIYDEPRISNATIPNTLKRDVFSMPTTRIVRTGPIPIDARIPDGIIFKVQVGAFKQALAQDAFTDMTPVTGETVGNGFTRYTAGMFMEFKSASNAKDIIRSRGYKDAFIVAYRDGKRIPLGEAMQEIEALSASGSIADGTPNSVTGPTPTSTSTSTPATVPTTTPTISTSPTVPGTVPVVPVTTAPTTPSVTTTEDATLATYPETAEELLSAFTPPADASTYYNDPTAAPATQVETVKGLFFTVQVGVYSKPVALDKIFRIDPLNTERTSTGKIRYTTGRFNNTDAASRRKNETVTLGVTDAYVTAYINGKRIPLSEARALLAKYGPSILAE